VYLVGQYNGLECYNQGCGYYASNIGFYYIFNRFNILLGSLIWTLILGLTEVGFRLGLRTSRAASFCAATRSKLLKLVKLSDLKGVTLKCGKCDNCVVKCVDISADHLYISVLSDKCVLRGDLRGNKCEVRCAKAGKLPLFYFRHVFRPIRAKTLEQFEILVKNCGCDELSSGPGPGNDNVDAVSMSMSMSVSVLKLVSMSVSVSMSMSTVLVYKKKTGKSKSNLYSYLYLELIINSIIEKSTSVRNKTF
jgi:hypothetical protein